MFFDRAVRFVSTTKAHFGYGDNRVYRIHASIIENVILEFYVEDDDPENNDLPDTSRSDSILRLLERTFDNNFTLTVRNGCHFDIVVGNVAIGISFIQVACSEQITRAVYHLSHFTVVWEGTVRMHVQSTTAINLQRKKEQVEHKSVRAYPIALDSAMNSMEVYIDVRIRVCVGDTIENFHLTATPATESHTGAVIFYMVSRVLRGALGSFWQVKILFVAIESAANMTGRFQGALTRFKPVCLPGLYCIWCAAHLLDLIVQHLMSVVLEETFRDPLVSLIGCLRRQTNLL